jgi:hypothetical protein
MATATKRRTVLLTTAQRQELESLLRRTTLAAGLARRARASLLSATGTPIPLSELLAGASYSDQWLPHLDGSRRADAAVCVFALNRVEHPSGCLLEYLGAFEYRVVHPEWLQRLLRGEAPNA